MMFNGCAPPIRAEGSCDGSSPPRDYHYPLGMENIFQAISPSTGLALPRVHRVATCAQIESICDAAGEAAALFGTATDERRAALLQSIARGIVDAGDRLLAVAHEETGLAAHPRLGAERDRTVFTLRTFAAYLRTPEWSRPERDAGDPARVPRPKPRLERRLIPLGPVAVFGASNFPLAYSTAGGDTASALAAGCPVVVKGHPLHPGTGEMVASIVHAAVREVGLPTGTFGYISSGGETDHAVGETLVSHPQIAAVGFTGSFGGGMALTRIAARRPVPIPVFAEMGSVNPIFVMPDAARHSPVAIAQEIAASVLGSCGQMCTCPGLIFVVAGSDGGGEGAQILIDELCRLFAASAAQPMLSLRIREIFLARIHACAENPGVEIIARGGHSILPQSPCTQPAILLSAPMAALERYPTLWEECFGPSTMIIRCSSSDEFEHATSRLPGSLAASIYFGDITGVTQASQKAARELAVRLSRRVGRVVFNGVPTGVEVAAAMVHGGPFPASNQAHSTAVGELAIERWCRPVCWQNWTDPS